MKIEKFCNAGESFWCNIYAYEETDEFPQIIDAIDLKGNYHFIVYGYKQIKILEE